VNTLEDLKIHLEAAHKDGCATTFYRVLIGDFTAGLSLLHDDHKAETGWCEVGELTGSLTGHIESTYCLRADGEVITDAGRCDVPEGEGTVLKWSTKPWKPDPQKKSKPVKQVSADERETMKLHPRHPDPASRSSRRTCRT